MREHPYSHAGAQAWSEITALSTEVDHKYGDAVTLDGTVVSQPPETGTAGAMSISGAKALAVFAPKPQQPYEVRSRHITGSGVCILTIDQTSGNVTAAVMTQSTGNAILDNSTLSAFRTWRFKPKTVAQVKIPISWTSSGASY
jgi:TonB family protein